MKRNFALTLTIGSFFLMLMGSCASGTKVASSKLKSTIEASEQDPFINYNKGVMLLHRKEYSASAGFLQKAVNEAPTNASYWYAYGLALSSMGEFQQAIQAFEKSLEIQPSLTDAHNNLGMLYTEMGKPEKALEEYGKVIKDKTYGTPYFPYFNIGLLKLKQNKNEEAIVAFEQAIQLKSDFYRAYAELAALYYKKGAYGDAYNAVKKAEKQYPNEAGLLLLEAQSQYELGNYKDAQRVLTKLSLLYPGTEIRKGMDQLKAKLTRQLLRGD